MNSSYDTEGGLGGRNAYGLTSALDARDFSGKFNTPLSPQEEMEYQNWAKTAKRTNDTYDYDMRGAWRAGITANGAGHFPDTYKKPNHPTFSNESQYSIGPHVRGGQWGTEDGQDTFAPGPNNYYTPQELQSYFNKTEPNARLLPANIPNSQPNAQPNTPNYPHPSYLPAFGIGQFRRTVNPGLADASRNARSMANILPFPLMQHIAGAVVDAATKNTQDIKNDKPVDVAYLTQLMRKNESSGNYQAVNRPVPGRKATSASGAYQYTDGTWNGYGGYKRAVFAPKEIQDQRFQEDINNRYQAFGGDPFKVIAAHYLPAYAPNPASWRQSQVVKGTRVPSVESYIRSTVKGTPLEAQFNEYLATHSS